MGFLSNLMLRDECPEEYEFYCVQFFLEVS